MQTGIGETPLSPFAQFPYEPLSLSRMMVIFLQESSDPQIISGQRKSSTQQGCNERNDTGDYSAPTAYMHRINPATHLGGLILFGVRFASCDLTAPSVEFEPVSGTQAVTTGRNDTRRTVREGYLAITRIGRSELFVHLLPTSVRRTVPATPLTMFTLTSIFTVFMAVSALATAPTGILFAVALAVSTVAAFDCVPRIAMITAVSSIPTSFATTAVNRNVIAGAMLVPIRATVVMSLHGLRFRTASVLRGTPVHPAPTTSGRDLHAEGLVESDSVPRERPRESGESEGEKKYRSVYASGHMQIVPETRPSLGE